MPSSGLVLVSICKIRTRVVHCEEEASDTKARVGRGKLLDSDEQIRFHWVALVLTVAIFCEVVLVY
jgi:hypothetical protein